MFFFVNLQAYYQISSSS